MKGIKAEGIIIRRINSGEADRILTILTRSEGKIRVKAKGVRKLNSRKGGNTEIFNRVKFTTVKGKNIDIITEIETLSSYSGLRHNLMLIGTAFHLCELIEKLLPEHQENNLAYELLIGIVDNLSQAKPDKTKLSTIVKSFETELLTILGFGLPQHLTQKELVDHIELILERPLKSRTFLNRIYLQK